MEQTREQKMRLGQESPVAVSSQVARRRGLSRRVIIENLQGWLFAAPFVFGLLTFFLIPMLVSLGLSLTSYNILQPPRFIGLGNYADMIHDPMIWHSLRVTTRFALISVPLNLSVGLAIAILLNQRVRGLTFFRTAFYLPTVVAGVAVAMMWEFMLSPRFGLVNYLLELLPWIELGPNWLGDPRFALWTFVTLSVWTIGWSMLINLSALQGVPTALYEAALVDGANSWQRFWYITIPAISPVIFFNLIIGIVNALQSFDLFFILTGGGPNNSTLTFMLYLYKTAFEYQRMGYASAMAWLLFAYLIVLTLIVFRSSSAWVYYEAETKR